MATQQEAPPVRGIFGGDVDPYPIYAAMRGGRRELRIGPFPIWMLSRYDEVLSAFKRPELFSSIAFRETRSDAMFPGVAKETLAQLRDVMRPDVPTVINTDPPAHARYRGILNRGFTPREMGKLEGRIREITHRLVDELIARGGPTDLVRDLTIPLPVTVIAELLGVDRARHADFKRWSDAFVGQARRGVELPPIIDAVREFNAYFEAEIERRRSEPSDDLISQLVHAETSEGRLSPLELLAFCRLLLVAGKRDHHEPPGQRGARAARPPERARAPARRARARARTPSRRRCASMRRSRGCRA